MITRLDQLDPNKKYTYKDYINWNLQERIELIRGKIFKMTPAPSTEHQRVSTKLLTQLANFLEGRRCEVFTAPIDVRFIGENSKIENTLQPDIVVVCDPQKIDERGILGAPDIVVEILSPSSSQKDLKDKYEVYQEYRVPEYWVIHPDDKTLLIYTLNQNGEYQPSHLFTRGDTIESSVLFGLKIDLNDVFRPFDWKKLEEEEAKYNRM